jgi:hypothetical protein
MQEIIDGNTCNKCRFAKLHLDGDGNQQWVCRRFPPQQTQLIIGLQQSAAGPQPQVNPASGFPLTMPDWSCGEFKSNVVVH